MKTRRMLLVSVAFAALNFQFLNTQLNAQVSFANATNFTVGTYPNSVISADFNGDGKIDLVTTNINSGNVSILLGNGSGSFMTAINFTVGSNPCSVTSADFNGDGKLDLAIARNGSNNVSILLGNGLGSFGSVTDFTVGSNPYSIISADFNGDGKIDLATANNGSGDVSVLLGDGLGGFSAATNFTVGTSPYSVVSTDLNGDSKMDLATANNGSGDVSVLLGDGLGGFSAATNFTAGSAPCLIISADFNGDSKMDLSVANYGSSNVSILLGDNTGNFSSSVDFAVSSNPKSVTAADLNGDGKIDLVTSNINSNNISVLLGNGLGSFGSATDFAVGTGPNSIISADFNGDGNIDLAVANEQSNNVSILLNNLLPPGAPICLITVDPTNTYNVIVWEKSSLNLAPIDSFIIYREFSTNNYQKIGHVSKDSLSTFTDNVNPSTTGYRYKLKVKNTSGISSNFSVYHNTIYLTNIGANFSWTPYQVENNTTPVANYNVYRDDSLAGNFQLIGNTTGNQFGYTDVDYSSFPKARYYVEAVMVSGSCSPTRLFSTARSNIKGFGVTGVQELPFAKVKVYPNPARDILNIDCQGLTLTLHLRLYDVVGKLVMEKVVENNTTINTSQLVNGVYFLSMEGDGVGMFNKVIVSH